MFGKKKDDNKLEEEQKKLEEQAALEAGSGGAGGLGGLKNFGEPERAQSEPAAQQKTEAKPESAESEPAAQPGTAESAPEAQPEKAEAAPEAQQPTEEPKPAEDDESPKPKKKASKSDVEKLKKQIETQKETMRELEKEKEEAMKKEEELAELIEDLSNEVKESKNAPQQVPPQMMPQMAAANIEPKLKELEEKTASQIKQLAETIQAMNKKKEEEGKGEEEVAETMKKMFDKRLKELSEKLEEAKAKPAPATQQGAKGEVSGGLMAMGGGVELKNEVDGFKKSLKDLATLLDAFKEEAENRFMAIDRELESTEKIPELEQKMEQFEKKLGPENVDRLRMLISNADDLKNEVIPLVVKRETEEKIDPFAKRVKAVEDVNEKVREKLAEVLLEIKADRKDIKSLYKFDDRIAKLEETATALKKGLVETNTIMKDLNKSVQKEMTEKMKEIFPGMIEAENAELRKDFASRFTLFSDKLQSLENSLSEAHQDIAALSALKGEFEALEDMMKKLEEKDEKLDERIDMLKDKLHDLRDEIEKLKTPKEIITELDNKTKDITEIREFFVRRADGLEEKIKEIDERAVPTRKLHEKVDALFKNLNEVKEHQKALDQKFDSEKKELQKLITQNAEEKKRLEGKLAQQKERIAYLLKEFK